MGVVKEAPHAGDLTQIARTVFWASLCSLDIMERIQGNHFKYDPLVSSELVKFLAINTGFEAIEQLKSAVEGHSTLIRDIAKSATTVDKSATTASNKADEARKAVDSLAKRVERLEMK
jgi:hypothetical protein